MGDSSLLSEYIDVGAERSAATTKDTAFLNAASAANDAIRADPSATGSATTFSTKKDEMTTVVNWYKQQNSRYAAFFETMREDTTNYDDQFNVKKVAVEALRKKVEEVKKLEGIRQEQVKSLEDREAANFHTSWMGLDRPLKEESRVGLAVAAGGFAFVALAAMVYLYQIQGAPDFGFFRGGFRRRKGRYLL